MPARPLKVIATEPRVGGRPCEALYSTDVTLTDAQIRTRYAGRWSIEETNQATKQHLGFEDP